MSVGGGEYIGKSGGNCRTGGRVQKKKLLVCEEVNMLRAGQDIWKSEKHGHMRSGWYRGEI